MSKEKIVGAQDLPKDPLFAKPGQRGEFTEVGQLIEDLRQYSIKEIDRLLVYLASGAIIFSMGFVKDIVPLKEAENLFYLKTSWLSFSLSLVVILFAHFMSKRLMEVFQKGKQKKIEQIKPLPNFITNISFLSFIVGLSCFVFFIMTNT